MKKFPVARPSVHKDTVAQAKGSRPPAVAALTDHRTLATGSMLPTHTPQVWPLHKFSGHLCPTQLPSVPHVMFKY